MYTGKTVFAQLMSFIPKYELRCCINRYRGNHKVISFSCSDQFLCLAFAQLTYRESLRDIEICPRSQQNKLYHIGIRGSVSRSIPADANENRDWRIYADFARLYSINQYNAFFITRTKSNFKLIKRYSHPIDKSTGLRCHQTIILTGFYSLEDYPEKYQESEKSHILISFRHLHRLCRCHFPPAQSGKLG